MFYIDTGRKLRGEEMLDLFVSRSLIEEPAGDTKGRTHNSDNGGKVQWMKSSHRLRYMEKCYLLGTDKFFFFQILFQIDEAAIRRKEKKRKTTLSSLEQPREG